MSREHGTEVAPLVFVQSVAPVGMMQCSAERAIRRREARVGHTRRPVTCWTRVQRISSLVW